MTPEQLTVLSVDVLNYLDVTWDDPALETKLMGITKRGMAYLDGIAGITVDYSIEGNGRALLFDYIRYVRSNSLGDFAINYLHELLTFQIGNEVAAYVSTLPIV